MAVMPEWTVTVALAIITATIAASAVLVPLWTMLRTFVLDPLRLRRIMAKQGVHGPQFRLFFGNSPEASAFAQSYPHSLPLTVDDYQPTATPQYQLWFPKYGKRFIYSVGSETRLVVRDAEMAKEVLSNKMGFFDRAPLDLYIFGHLIGKGVFVVKDQEWALHRRVLNPFFSQESLKAMVASIVRGTEQELQKWEKLARQAGGTVEHDVEHDIHVILGKIITYTAFSDDYEKAKQIHELQDEMVGNLFAALASPKFWIPGYRLLPTKQGTRIAQLNNRTEKLIMAVIKDRTKGVEQGQKDSFGDDLLGRMLTACYDTRAAPSTKQFGLDAVFNNCKNIFFAGQDTSANLTSFSLLMLANHPDWQERAREEISEVLGEKQSIGFDDVSRLKVDDFNTYLHGAACVATLHAGAKLLLGDPFITKLGKSETVGMIVQEVSRLFAVSPSMTRVATKDFQLGDLFIPKGLAIEIAALAMHRDVAYWGSDAALFNPARFAEGAAHACTHANAFLPFGAGPRRCIADKLAMVEVKTVLALILRTFRISPSAKYAHHPCFAMVIRPKFGLPLVLHSLLSQST